RPLITTDSLKSSTMASDGVAGRKLPSGLRSTLMFEDQEGGRNLARLPRRRIRGFLKDRHAREQDRVRQRFVRGGQTVARRATNRSEGELAVVGDGQPILARDVTRDKQVGFCHLEKRGRIRLAVVAAPNQ